MIFNWKIAPEYIFIFQPNQNINRLLEFVFFPPKLCLANILWAYCSAGYCMFATYTLAVITRSVFLCCMFTSCYCIFIFKFDWKRVDFTVKLLTSQSKNLNFITTLHWLLIIVFFVAFIAALLWCMHLNV